MGPARRQVQAVAALCNPCGAGRTSRANDLSAEEKKNQRGRTVAPQASGVFRLGWGPCRSIKAMGQTPVFRLHLHLKIRTSLRIYRGWRLVASGCGQLTSLHGGSQNRFLF